MSGRVERGKKREGVGEGRVERGEVRRGSGVSSAAVEVRGV